MHGNFETPKMQALELKHHKMQALELRHQWQVIRRQNPLVGIREAAYILDVSEAELLASSCGEGVTRLRAPWEDLLKQIFTCGSVRAQTRSDFAVLEANGEYKPISFEGPHGMVLNDGIDLRFTMEHWKLGFAVETFQEDETSQMSFQFFSSNGTAIHKVFLLQRNNIDSIRTLVDQYQHEDQFPAQPLEPVSGNSSSFVMGEIDRLSFLNDWKAMKNTHEFFRLLRHYKISRTQAFLLAEGEMTDRLGRFEFRTLLREVSETEQPLMVFIGNPGCTQIYSGKIASPAFKEPWTSIGNGSFSIYLDRTGIGEAWRVRKPTDCGTVTSLELYDKRGGQIATFFSKRKQGEKESSSWREIIYHLQEENLEYNVNHLGEEVKQPFSIPPGVLP